MTPDDNMKLLLSKKIWIVVALVFLVPAAAQAATIGRPPMTSFGLVGYWSFDGYVTDWATGQTRDLSGNNNPGLLGSMSTTTSPATGKIGQGMFFDGETNFIQVDDASPLDSTSALTIATWVKATDWTGTGAPLTATILKKNGNYILRKDELAASGGRGFKLYWWDGAGNIRYTLATVPSAGVWHHIVGVVQNNDVSALYIDGVSVGSAAATSEAGTRDLTDPMSFGANTSASERFRGIIDEMRVYNRALSAAEVKQLYTSGTVIFADTTSATSSPFGLGLVAHWTFDGADTPWTSASAGTTFDKSGNGNTGTLTSMTRTGSVGLGKIGQAISVSGGARVVVNDSGTLDVTNNATICLWMKARSFTSTSDGPLIKKDGHYLLRVNDFAGANLAFRWWTAASGLSLISTAHPSLNEWHHICGTVRADVMTGLYVDGTLRSSSVSVVGNVRDLTQSLTIGSNGALEHFNGFIDDVRIYNRHFSAAQIKALYNIGTANIGRTTSGTQGPIPKNLLAHWSFDGSVTRWSTGRTSDISGNNTGQLISMSTSTSPTLGKVGQAFIFNGVSSSVNVSATVSGIQSVAFWIKSTSTQQIMDFNGTQSIEMLNGTITANNFSGPTVYVDGSETSTLPDANWHHVVVTTGSSFSGSAITLGKIGTGFYGGVLDDIRLYSRALTSREVKQLYSTGQ
jgi:hypothetical protein